MSEANVKTVQTLYAAFGRNDLPAILAHVTDDTRWDFNVGASDVPWHLPIDGKANLPRFFAAMAEHMAIEAFEPSAFVAAGDHVVVRVHLAFTNRRTGKRVDQQQVHWWTLDGHGLVASLRHYEDTAAVLGANRA